MKRNLKRALADDWAPCQNCFMPFVNDFDQTEL